MVRLFKQKLPLREQGFTLAEVLIAIIITTLFVGVTMQGMVIAVLFRVKAQEYTEATSWIQEDLEDVKYKADNFQFPQTKLTADAIAGSSSITVVSSQNPSNIFAANDTLKVGLDPAIYKVTVINGNSLTITPNLGTTQFQNAAVIATKMCNPSAKNAGLADGLRDTLTGASTVDSSYPVPDLTRTIRTGKSLSLRRTTTLSDALPYNVLQVSYLVWPTSQKATLTSDVAVGVSSINVTSNVALSSLFKTNDSLKVGLDPVTYKVTEINGNTLTITPSLGTAQSQNSLVIATRNITAQFYTEVIPSVAFQCSK